MNKKTTGIYQKFTVTRNDGKDAPGEKHDGCEYFVLDVTHDPHAKAALLAYADSCVEEYPLLARDVTKMADWCPPLPVAATPAAQRIRDVLKDRGIQPLSEERQAENLSTEFGIDAPPVYPECPNCANPPHEGPCKRKA